MNWIDVLDDVVANLITAVIVFTYLRFARKKPRLLAEATVFEQPQKLGLGSVGIQGELCMKIEIFNNSNYSAYSFKIQKLKWHDRNARRLENITSGYVISPFPDRSINFFEKLKILSTVILKGEPSTNEQILDLTTFKFIPGNSSKHFYAVWNFVDEYNELHMSPEEFIYSRLHREIEFKVSYTNEDGRLFKKRIYIANASLTNENL
jgi:hypothetical protein